MTLCWGVAWRYATWGADRGVHRPCGPRLTSCVTRAAPTPLPCCASRYSSATAATPPSPRAAAARPGLRAAGGADSWGSGHTVAPSTTVPPPLPSGPPAGDGDGGWGTGNLVAPGKSAHAPAPATGLGGPGVAGGWGQHNTVAPAKSQHAPEQPRQVPTPAPVPAAPAAAAPATGNAWGDANLVAPGKSAHAPDSAAAPASGAAAPLPPSVAAVAASEPSPLLGGDLPDGSIRKFVADGGRFPIMLLTCNRETFLRKTLDSLLKVRGVTKDLIYVVQDGNYGPVKDVVDEYGLKLHQHLGSSKLRRGRPLDGAQRIARHYGYAMSYMFDTAVDAPGVVVVEDDFFFAPDFMDYFRAATPLLELDDSLWVVSAWNDNGFSTNVRDPYRLKRTRYFPGLGWFISRRLFKDELQKQWPTTHWDHWMRSDKRHKGRDCLYPEVNRDYHMGVKGTFMDASTHQRYFASIAMNRDETFSWDSPKAHDSLMTSVRGKYDARIRQEVANARHLRSLEEIASFDEGIGVVWYRAQVEQQYTFQAISKYFHVWHEILRGSREGVHELWWVGTARLYLINTAVSDLVTLKPSDLPVFMPRQFERQQPPPRDTIEEAAGKGQAAAGGAAAAAPPAGEAYEIVAGKLAGESCQAVCEQAGRKCLEHQLTAVNTCPELRKAFGCVSCSDSEGPDQPAYVIPSAPNSNAGKCLINNAPNMFSCSGSYQYTRRLCACGKA